MARSSTGSNLKLVDVRQEGACNVLVTNSLKASASALFAFSLLAVACTTVDDGAAAGPPQIGDPNPNGKPPGESCTTADECRTGVCTGGTCQAATNTDGVRNGDETDVDCGGSAGPTCASGKRCAADTSCASGSC